MNYIIGIDFGTTKTMVSWFDPDANKARLLQLGRETAKMPTTIYVGEDKIFCGEEADDWMNFNPSRYMRAFKLKLGCNYPLMTVTFNGKKQAFRASDLTREFLKYIKRQCEQKFLHYEQISGAVITIPVSFSPAQKQELEQAAKDAGYCDVILLPEPEAAGLTYVSDTMIDQDKNIMIVDWGGGTVDFAAISKNINGEIYTIDRSFDGDKTCGGEKFDELLWRHAIAKISSIDTKRRDPKSEPLKTIRKMRKEVRNCKERLSAHIHETLILPGEGGVFPAINITQVEFSSLIETDVNRIASNLSQRIDAIKQSGKTCQTLLMIGGSSRIPKIKEILSRESGLECITSWKHADDAVAIGAAIYASRNLASQTEGHVSDSYVYYKCPECHKTQRLRILIHCKGCDAVFPASRNLVNRAWGHVSDSYVYYKCPECHKTLRTRFSICCKGCDAVFPASRILSVGRS